MARFIAKTSPSVIGSLIKREAGREKKGWRKKKDSERKLSDEAFGAHTHVRALSSAADKCTDRKSEVDPRGAKAVQRFFSSCFSFSVFAHLSPSECTGRRGREGKGARRCSSSRMTLLFPPRCLNK